MLTKKEQAAARKRELARGEIYGESWAFEDHMASAPVGDPEKRWRLTCPLTRDQQEYVGGASILLGAATLVFGAVYLIIRAIAALIGGAS